MLARMRMIQAANTTHMWVSKAPAMQHTHGIARTATHPWGCSGGKINTKSGEPTQIPPPANSTNTHLQIVQHDALPALLCLRCSAPGAASEPCALPGVSAVTSILWRAERTGLASSGNCEQHAGGGSVQLGLAAAPPLVVATGFESKSQHTGGTARTLREAVHRHLQPQQADDEGGAPHCFFIRETHGDRDLRLQWANVSKA